MKIDKKLTNKDISDNHRDADCYLSFGSFVSYLIANVIKQAEEDEIPYDLNRIYKECKSSFGPGFGQGVFGVARFSYESLDLFLTQERLAEIPSLLEMNQGEKFISLGALAHCMFYDILRESITQPLD
ncbi:MAG: hypothetical protein ACI8Q1_000265 [Parvicella sp.]|jgi:hypothetical protein